jgi:hypothetical protein
MTTLTAGGTHGSQRKTSSTMVLLLLLLPYLMCTRCCQARANGDVAAQPVRGYGEVTCSRIGAVLLVVVKVAGEETDVYQGSVDTTLFEMQDRNQNTLKHPAHKHG